MTANAQDWPERWKELVRALVRVQGASGQEQLLDWLAQPPHPFVLAFVNAHAMNSAVGDAAFFNALRQADMLLRDGVGTAILLGLLNQQAGLNLNGTDLIPRLIQRHRGESIALFGTARPWLSKAAEVVRRELAPGATCITAHGFLPTAHYLRLAQAHRPRLIVLAMGMPRQEEVALALRSVLDHRCLIVCGGAILDFLGGRVPRAPAWARQLGLEWAWRLAREPRRLFRRYVVGNPLFLVRALRLALYSLRQVPRRDPAV